MATRTPTKARHRLRCGNCSRLFDWSGRGRRPTYCGDVCRKRAARLAKIADAKAGASNVVKIGGRRERAKPAAEVDPNTPPDPDGPLYTATLAELEVLGRQATSDGLAALFLARSIDESTGETGSGKKALVSEWRVQKELALRVEGDAGDEVDEMRARRAGRGGR